MDKEENNIASPCVRNCCLDDNDICLGCFRSLTEITEWTLVDNQGRAAFMKNANERRCLQDRKKQESIKK